MGSECVVVIPLYKNTLSDFEKKSLTQCINILKDYDICILTHNGVNVNSFERRFNHSFKSVIFDKENFLSQKTYSKLCENPNLYRSFSEYKYMLIYQLDCWIFRDELSYFCELGYDYIGAPHCFENNDNPIVGNGGFSLRKIDTFIEAFSTHKNETNLLEDQYISHVLKDVINIAHIDVACKFASQNHFDWVLNHNDGKLPMGCHNPLRFNTSLYAKYIECLIPKKKLCLTTISTDSFVDGTMVMIYSFLKSNKWFDGDIVVMYNDSISKLSENSKKKISTLYDKIVYKNVPYKDYEGFFYHWRGKVADRFRPSAFTIEAFALEYESIIYLDSDMLVIGDISDCINDSYSIACCNHERNFVNSPRKITSSDYINAGFFFINKNLVSSTVKYDILKIAETFNFNSSDFHRNFEQDVLNVYLKSTDCTILPNVYNTMKRIFKYNKLEITNEKIIHYVEGKPWNTNDSSYTYIYGKWKDYYKEMNNQDTPKKKRYVIYTCITGGYDNLKNLTYYNHDVFDYVCFTDNKNMNNFGHWEIREIPKDLLSLSTVKQQRNVKICPHKYLSNYALSVWIDGNIDVVSDIVPLIKKVYKPDVNIYIPKHPSRSCIYDEAKACKKIKKDTAENIDRQMAKFKAEGFPAKFGLPQSNIIIRYHNDEGCKRLMNLWAQTLNEGSHRDQLSFNYALWKNQDVNVIYLDKKIYCSEWFRWDVKHGLKAKATTSSKVAQTSTDKKKESNETSDSHIISTRTNKIVPRMRTGVGGNKRKLTKNVIYRIR